MLAKEEEEREEMTSVVERESYKTSLVYQQLTPFCQTCLDILLESLKKIDNKVNSNSVLKGPFHIDMKNGFIVAYRHPITPLPTQISIDCLLNDTAEYITKGTQPQLAKWGFTTNTHPTENQLSPRDDDTSRMRGVGKLNGDDHRYALFVGHRICTVECSTDVIGQGTNYIHHALTCALAILSKVDEVYQDNIFTFEKVLFMPILVLSLTERSSVDTDIISTNDHLLQFFSDTHLSFFNRTATKFFKWMTGPVDMYVKVSLYFFKEVDKEGVDEFMTKSGLNNSEPKNT